MAGEDAFDIADPLDQVAVRLGSEVVGAVPVQVEAHGGAVVVVALSEAAAHRPAGVRNIDIGVVGDRAEAMTEAHGVEAGEDGRMLGDSLGRGDLMLAEGLSSGE